MPDGPGEAGTPTLGRLTPLTDIGLWARSSGLEIVLFVTGPILATRFAAWLGARITTRIDKHPGDADTILRTEASKHRHAVTRVVTWTVLVLLYCATGGCWEPGIPGAMGDLPPSWLTRAGKQPEPAGHIGSPTMPACPTRPNTSAPTVPTTPTP